MKQSNEVSPWQAWAFDVIHKLTEQRIRIDLLDTQVAVLQEQLMKLEARPTYTIESIEYHFDQLKVEKLDGTLNIGMSTPGSGDHGFPGTIEQLQADKIDPYPKAEPNMPAPSMLYNRVYEQMNHYLDSEAELSLAISENDANVTLDPYHRGMIIEDIRRQLPTRIQFYLNQEGSASKNLSNKNEDAIYTNVLQKTKRDAQLALQAYMKQLQQNSSSQRSKA